MDNLSTKRRTGTISKYDDQRLFGFIKPDCGGVRTFFHVSDFDVSDREPFVKLDSVLFLRVSYLPYMRQNRDSNKDDGLLSLQYAAKEIAFVRSPENDLIVDEEYREKRRLENLENEEALDERSDSYTTQT